LWPCWGSSPASRFLTLSEDGDPAGAGILASELRICGAFLLTTYFLSSGRRQRTLGLLLLSRAKGLEIVLAKLAAAGLVPGCGLLAFLPRF